MREAGGNVGVFSSCSQHLPLAISRSFKCGGDLEGIIEFCGREAQRWGSCLRSPAPCWSLWSVLGSSTMTFTGHTQVGIVMILVRVYSRVSSKTDYRRGGGIQRIQLKCYCVMCGINCLDSNGIGLHRRLSCGFHDRRHLKIILLKDKLV